MDTFLFSGCFELDTKKMQNLLEIIPKCDFKQEGNKKENHPKKGSKSNKLPNLVLSGPPQEDKS